jgi:hypothetical protein
VSGLSTPYPGYDVLAKWDSPSWNEQTRRAVGQRLDEAPPRRFFSPGEWSLLESIVDRLVPQPEREQAVPIVPWIDAMLAGEGPLDFRYADMPPAREAWRRGLAGIDTEARQRHEKGFGELADEDKDRLLRDVEHGKVAAREWGDLPASGFFRQVLLKQVVGIYYAHPAAWSEIGFGGPASPRGYVRLGFDERDPWEAEEVRTPGA